MEVRLKCQQSFADGAGLNYENILLASPFELNTHALICQQKVYSTKDRNCV